MKKWIVILLAILFSLIFSITTFASPVSTYTHIDTPSGETKLQFAREMFVPEKYITAKTLGLNDSFSGISDICVSQSGKILLLCGENSRVIELNKDYSLSREINITMPDGKKAEFNNAKGIFMDNIGDIYIADTDNARVLIADNNGLIKRNLELPESNFIPEDFIYQPIKVAKDSAGFLYVLSSGSFYGALQYNNNFEFLGFYGSNSVQATALDTLNFLWNKLTSNEIKKSKSTKKTPYSFIDFDFDSMNYLVTCTGKTEADKNGVGQIRKINHSGANILFKKTSKEGYKLSSTVNFLEENLLLWEERTGKKYPQDLIAVAVDDKDFIYALDNLYGRVYVYDSECNLINALGGGMGDGSQVGVFKNAVALAINGEHILVADSEQMSLTVFYMTDYGRIFKKAQSLYIKGDYLESKPYWEEVIKLDSGNQYAYRGIASAFYNEGEYKKAIEYAKLGLDYNIYDLSQQELVKKNIAKYFLLYLFIVFSIMGIAIYYFKFNKKKRIIISNEKVRVLKNISLHPFDSFASIKYKNQGSVKLAIFLNLLLYIAFFLRDTASGFLYTTDSIASYNSLYTLVKTFGIVILWSVCFWLVSSVTSGKGSFSEIYISTSYSTIILIIYSFIRVSITNILPYSAFGIVTTFDTIVWIITFFIFIVGMMTVSEYDFFKFIFTGLISIFFMILIMFVIFMCALMIKQAWQFIAEIFHEIVFG